MNDQCKVILLTTPDYPPKKIGGISTFVINLEKVLKKLGQEYELFIWHDINDIKSKDFSSYSQIINVHFMPAFFKKHAKTINIIHGGELLPYSKNPLKHLYKKIMHKNFLRRIANAKHNIFVSEYSYNLFKDFSGEINLKRDIVYHNCIDIKDAENKNTSKNMKDKLRLVCFVRDVAHKNIDGVVKLFNMISSKHEHGVELYITAKRDYNNENIIDICGISDEGREEILKKAHFNILLSLDHSKRGHFEGFGLTVLEAGKYGVPSVGMNACGLAESIHHKETGWLFEDNNFENFEEFYTFMSSDYHEISEEVYKHTLNSHGLDEQMRLIGSIL